jgi:hypothetical protein
MRVFTKLGIAFLLAVFTTGMLWAQLSEAEIVAKMKASGASRDVITGHAITDANVIATGIPMDVEKIISLNIPRTTNLKGTDDTDIIGGTSSSWSNGPRSRGNAFHCTVAGKILTEFMGWHTVTIKFS